MNKKLSAVSLLSCLCILMTACGSEENVSSDSGNNSVNNVSEEEWLKEISLIAVDNLSELTNDDTYIAAFINSDEITDLIGEWKSAEVSTDEIYVTHISENSTETFLQSSGGIDYKNLSPVAKKSIYNKMGQSVPTYITNRYGVNYMAAVSVLNHSVSYATEYDIDNQIWFIPTDKDGLAVCVSFGNSGEGIISVSSTYLYYGEEESLKNALDTYLSYMGIEVQRLN